MSKLATEPLGMEENATPGGALVRDAETLDLLEQAQELVARYKHSRVNINEEELGEYQSLARKLKSKGAYDEAIEIFTIILETLSKPETYIFRAECYKEKGKYVEAAKDISNASKMAPFVVASRSSVSWFDRVTYLYQKLDIKLF